MTEQEVHDLIARDRAVRASKDWKPSGADRTLVDRFLASALARQGLVDDTSPTGRWLLFLQGIPGFSAQFSQVPAAYVEPTAETVDDGSVSIAVVRCPCGELPNVEAGHVAHCLGRGCGRSYLHIAGRVYVAFGPRQDPPEACVLDTDAAEQAAQASGP